LKAEIRPMKCILLNRKISLVTEYSGRVLREITEIPTLHHFQRKYIWKDTQGKTLEIIGGSQLVRMLPVTQEVAGSGPSFRLKTREI